MFVLLLFLIMLVSIVLHEGGHALVGKICGVPADDFCVGFGPSLICVQKESDGKRHVRCEKKCGTEHTGTAFRLKPFPFGGSCSFDDSLLEQKSPWAKIAIFFAGPFANIVLGFVFYAIAATGVSGFLSAAGDYFRMLIMFVPDTIVSLGRALVPSQSMTMVDSVNVMGTQYASLNAHQAFLYLMVLAALINIVLAIVNLIPVPCLDGGQIVLAVPELFHKKPDPKKLNVIYKVAYCIVGGYMVLWGIKELIMMGIKLFG